MDPMDSCRVVSSRRPLRFFALLGFGCFSRLNPCDSVQNCKGSEALPLGVQLGAVAFAPGHGLHMS